MPSIATIIALSLALLASRTDGAPVSLASVVRQESCSEADCWNRNALRFVNKYRSSQGKGALVSGPAPMLANAVAHSRAQDAGGKIFHQDLNDAGEKVGCGLFVNRENVAMFGGAGSVDGKGASRQFMDQWIGSEGHRRNILDANAGDKVVVGVFVGVGKAGGFFGAGRPVTYGTQVFATGDSTCGDAPTPAATGAPTAAPTTTAETNAMPTTIAKESTALSTDTEVAVTFAAVETIDDADNAAAETETTDSPSETASADTTTTAAPVMEDAADEEAGATGEQGDEVAGEKMADRATSAPTMTDFATDGDNGSTGTDSVGRGRRTLTFNSWNEFLAWFRKANRGRGGYKHI